MAGENIVNLSDLTFDKLNDNDCNVVFGVLGDDEINDLTVDLDTWRRMSSGQSSNGTIDHWYLFTRSLGSKTYTALLGTDCDSGGPYITSPVVAVAPDTSALITESGSLYKLWEQSDDEQMHVSFVLHIVHALRHWGMGQIVKDWPKVSY